MTIMHAFVAGLAMLIAQPTVAPVSAQPAGPRVVAAANGDVAAKTKAAKAATKSTKGATSGKAKRSVPAIIASPNAALTATARSAPRDSARSPAPPAHRAGQPKKH